MTANKFGFAVLLKVCPYSREINSSGISLSFVSEHRRGSIATGARLKKWEGRRLFQSNVMWVVIQKCRVF